MQLQNIYISLIGCNCCGIIAVIVGNLYLSIPAPKAHPPVPTALSNHVAGIRKDLLTDIQLDQ